MNEQGLMAEGFTLLLLGMGTVFVFLTVLVLVTSVMSYVIQTRFPEATVSPAGGQPAKLGGTADRQLIAVITAAIHQHRHSKDR